MNTYYFKITVVFIVTLFFKSSMYTKSSCVLVHGTWAKDEQWYQPGGDFFEAIRACNQELNLVDEVVSFSWSGKLGYPAQLQAAQDLAKIIELYDRVILIGHSHGVTVGILASQIISKSDTDGNKIGKVDKFYALGAPVDEAVVTPNMFVIKKFYNLFSFGDLVQTVNGNCERIFSTHDRIANISIKLFDVHPNHFQLHHPVIGKYLLKIDEYFSEQRIGNFQNLNFSIPGVIHFLSDQFPLYEFQSDQKKLLEHDKHMHKLMTMAFFRGGNDLEK